MNDRRGGMMYEDIRIVQLWRRVEQSRCLHRLSGTL